MTLRKQKITRSIILSAVTLGVCGLVWQYRLIRNTQTLKTEAPNPLDELACIALFPFYSIFWWITRAKTVETVYSRNGLKPTGRIWMYVLFSVLGLGIVNAAMMQDSFNKAPDKPLDSPVTADARKSGRILLVFRCLICFPLVPLYWLYGSMPFLLLEDNHYSVGNRRFNRDVITDVGIVLIILGILLIIASVITRVIINYRKKTSGKEALEEHE